MSNTLLPFLYHTQTLERLAGASSRVSTLRVFTQQRTYRGTLFGRGGGRSSRRTARAARLPDPIPFEIPDDVGGARKQEEPEMLESDSENYASTITPSEKAAFDSIFADIAFRTNAKVHMKTISGSQHAHASGQSSLSGTEDSSQSASPLGDFDPFKTRPSFPNPEIGRQSINIIVQDAALGPSSRNPWDAMGAFGKIPVGAIKKSNRFDKDAETLMRFPPSLRRAARMALTTMEEQRDTLPGTLRQNSSFRPDFTQQDYLEEDDDNAEALDRCVSPLAQSVQMEAARRTEGRRVEEMMENARTDQELWNVLEAEVFPMVDKLGITEKHMKKLKRRGGKKAAAAGSEEPELRIDLHGPLYPSYLLYALRKLDQKFTRSSPFLLNILPRVKELGLASYVLGASTPFYNALLEVMWHRYGDVFAVLDLLEEMRHAGLYCDEITKSLMHRIQSFFHDKAGIRDSVNRVTEHAFLREMMELPEFKDVVGRRLRHWLFAIDMSIEERKGHLGF